VGTHSERIFNADGQKGTPVQKLETELRDLIEQERVAFVEMFSKQIRQGIDSFLERRKPNLYLSDVYHNFVPPGLMEATNVREAEAAFRKQIMYRYLSPADRPHFEVSLLLDADEQIRKIAERQAEDMIQTFVHRVMSKLGPVVNTKSDFQIERIQGRGLSGGAWEGDLRFTFEDGTYFSANLKIITNYSKFHVPFGQYPMRFYDCSLMDTGRAEMGRCGFDRADLGFCWVQRASAGSQGPEVDEARQRLRGRDRRGLSIG
jgi:hypothetical protein